MAVTLEDFLSSADAMLKTGVSEIDFRNAASRAYYSAYHIAVALADQLEPTGAIVGGHHEAVIKILTGQRTSPFALSCRRAGYILAGMRTIRHSADYQLGKTFSHGQAEDLIARVPAVRDSITEAFDRRA